MSTNGEGRTEPRAFTLVELLVVIAIVGLLAALLSPALRAAKEKGRQVACLNNLKQIGYAFHMYFQDNDGFFPPANSSSTNRWSNCNIIGHYLSPPDPSNSLLPRVGYEIVKCPSKVTAAEAGYGGSGWHYAYNGMLNSAYGVTRFEQCKRPMGMVMDGVNLQFWSDLQYFDLTNVNCRFMPRHSAGANILFSDGHAEWMEKNYVIQNREYIFNPTN